MITYLEETMVKQILKFFGMHLMCAIGSMLVILIFPGIVSFKFGVVLYSVFAPKIHGCIQSNELSIYISCDRKCDMD